MLVLQAELASVRDELTVTKQENQHLQMQLAEKERTLQATKADLIETRLELQRTEARLTARPLPQSSKLIFMQTAPRGRAAESSLYPVMAIRLQAAARCAVLK